MNQNLRNLTVAGLCLALCIVLPFITGNIPQIGQALSPMHIPVLVCGFLAGPAYGAIVGFIGPLLRSVMFGMPPMMRAIPMAFELCAYGMISGAIYKMLPKNMVNIYVALIAAMLGGRVVWGIASFIMYSTQGNPFTLQTFLAGAFLGSIPGIILHLLLIPAIVRAVDRKNF